SQAGRMSTASQPRARTKGFVQDGSRPPCGPARISTARMAATATATSVTAYARAAASSLDARHIGAPSVGSRAASFRRPTRADDLDQRIQRIGGGEDAEQLAAVLKHH